MQKILIAIDYSPLAQIVVERGYSLGAAMGAEIFLLHIISDSANYYSSMYDPIMGFSGFIRPEPNDTNNSAHLEKEAMIYLERTKLHLQDPKIKLMIVVGSVADMILETAIKISTDIIVLGTHSRNGLEEFLLGSTAHKLLKHSNIPLFIIPAKSE